MKDKIELIIINTIVIISFIILCLIGTYYLTQPKEEEQEITEEIETFTQKIMEKYYNNIFEKHSSNFCGQINYSDVFEVYYVNTKSFNTIEEMKNNYKTYLSEKYIEENLIDKFKEKEEKLYCLVKQSSNLIYKTNSYKITNIIKTENEIKVEGTFETDATELRLKETFNSKATLIKENNNWVINNYQDIYNKES